MIKNNQEKLSLKTDFNKTYPIQTDIVPKLKIMPVGGIKANHKNKQEQGLNLPRLQMLNQRTTHKHQKIINPIII